MPELQYAADGRHDGWLVQYMPVPLVPVKFRRFVRLDGTKLSAFKRGNKPTSGPVWLIDLAGADVETFDRDYRICITVEDEGRKRRKRFFVLACMDDKAFIQWSYWINRASKSVLEIHYDLERLIDVGSFSTVVLGRDKKSGRPCAIKLIEKTRVPESKKIYIERELQIVKLLEHDNVVETYDVFNSDARARIVMEYVRGGTLTELLSRKSRLAEVEAKLVIKGILKGVDYLHLNGIVHRDLSTKNILCPSLERPKISDFGLSNFYKTSNMHDAAGISETRERLLKSTCGTTVFMAPEILAYKPYSREVDLWSTGVILYNLIVGELPFEGSTLAAIVRNVRKGNIRQSPDPVLWSYMSLEVKDLLFRLLKIEPHERISASEALRHSWFAG